MSHWSIAAPAPVLLVAFALWLAAGTLFYFHWKRSSRRKVTALLEGLRFLLITCLLVTLLRPERVRLIDRQDPPEVAILGDISGSMNTRDLVISNTVLSRADWLLKQKQREFWKPLETSGKVVHASFPAPDPSASSPPAPATPANPTQPATNTAPAAVPSEHGTDLAAALEEVLKRQDNLKAVLLLSDGDWNLGKSPLAAATQFRDRQIPVFSVAVGRETPLPDLALESVSVPSYGLFGEQISIPFKVQSHLPREVKTTVTLADAKGSVETQKEITIPPFGLAQDAVLWAPRTVGEASLKLSIPVETDEYLPENNQQTFRINIRVETLKVLVVDSLPRWEYRFLRNALARDPGVEMHCLLLHPGMGTGGGRHYLSSFPNTKEAISRYDVIFLGDVGIGENELSEADAELIKGLVEQQSSGLVFLPGRRGRQLTLLQSKLADLLPVVLDTAKPEGIGLVNEASLQLSTVGKGHLLTRFDANEEWNDQLWSQLPGFFWSAAVEKSRPGSEVLAVHSALRNSWGRMPLLVTRSFGNGKVLFMGTDSAWRWRRGVEDKFHYRFWSQVVRWMAHQRHLAEKEGIRLSFTPETPMAGDTLFLQATVLDAAGFPAEGGPVLARITLPSGKTERLEFTALEGGWGVFKSSLNLPEGGVYQVRVSSERHNRALETEIRVHKPVLEKEGRPANIPVLRELSGISRGDHGPIESLDQIVQKISLLPEPKPIEMRLRLWSDPRWGGLILALLGFYWTGRKLAGMI